MPATTDIVRNSELRDVHLAQPLGSYLRETWQRRDYIWYESTSELRARRVNTVLGNLWHLLTPILNIAVYYLIFGLILQIDRGVDNLMLYLSVGVLVFTAFRNTTNRATRSIVSNIGLIRSIKFPRVILPLTSSLAETLASIPLVGLIYVVAFLTGQPPLWEWLFLVPISLCLVIFNTGAAMLAARATTHFRDLQQILPFAFRILFYASGVIFNVRAYAEDKPLLLSLFVINPIYCYITLARWAVMGGDEVTAPTIISAVVWTVAIIFGGFFWFRAGEREYSRG